MKDVNTLAGLWYTVSSVGACTVTATKDGQEFVLAELKSAGQRAFQAIGLTVQVSDDAAVVLRADSSAALAAMALDGGGGASVTVDATYSATSANPQAGTAVMGAFTTYLFNVDQTGLSWGSGAKTGEAGSVAIGLSANTAAHSGSIAIGNSSQTTGNASVAIGSIARGGYKGVSIGHYSSSAIDAIAISTESKALGEHAISIGRKTNANEKNTMALGFEAKSTAAVATAIGTKATVADAGVTCISAWDSTNLTTQTQFYLIGAGSALATTYEGGEACLGYVVKDTSGNILFCGTRKLSELLTNNTAFAPAALDLDAPAPTPFLPTGIMEPIVFDEPDDINLQ